MDRGNGTLQTSHVCPLQQPRALTHWAVRSTVHPSVRSQEDVYRATTQHLVEGVVSGYNATVFAYGPSGRAPGSAPRRAWGGGSGLSLMVQDTCHALVSPTLLSWEQPREAGQAIPFLHTTQLGLS